jgi:hypothetical protein
VLVADGVADRGCDEVRGEEHAVRSSARASSAYPGFATIEAGILVRSDACASLLNRDSRT